MLIVKKLDQKREDWADLAVGVFNFACRAQEKYANGDYPNADIINENGLYVGLHYSVTPEQISWFVKTINDI